MTYAEVEPLETWVKPMKDQNGNFDFTEVDRAQSRNYTQGSKIQMVRVITPAGTSAQEVRLTDGTDTALINTDGSLKTDGVSVLVATNTTYANNNSQTVLTAGVSGYKIYGFTVQRAGSAGGGYVTVTIAGVTVFKEYNIAAGSTTSQISFGSNFIEITNGQTVVVTTDNVVATAFCSVIYK